MSNIIHKSIHEKVNSLIELSENIRKDIVSRAQSTEKVYTHLDVLLLDFEIKLEKYIDEKREILV